MIRKLKANKILSLLLFGLCLFFLFNPKICSESCLMGVSVWAFKVFPVLFPFFILTRLIVSLSANKKGRLDKFFSKFYNAPTNSLEIFLLSVLSGYPMGAKLICNAYDDKKINSIDATKMLSFCSMAGPMFILGTIGIAIIKNYTCSIIILISNIIACLINGIVFSKFSKTKTDNDEKLYYQPKKPIDFAQIVYDSLISVLMVGAYISLSFIFIEVFKVLKIFESLSIIISFIFRIDKKIVYSFLIGFIEITKGAIEISNLTASLSLKTTLISGIVGFGGISVMMQSLSFLRKLKIKTKTMFIQKLIQGIFSTIFAFILTLIIKC